MYVHVYSAIIMAKKNYATNCFTIVKFTNIRQSLSIGPKKELRKRAAEEHNMNRIFIYVCTAIVSNERELSHLNGGLK